MRVKSGLGGALGRLAGATVLVAALLCPVVPARADVAGPEPALLDLVILADESGSLSPADVAEEIKASATSALSLLNSRSRVSVYGFGSQNRPGQNVITEACPPTTVDSVVKQEALASCVRKLHRREDAEGNDTDHAAALTKAIDTLEQGGPPGALRVVLLLTDGRLDVSRSPQYGRIAQERNQEAGKQIRSQLALAAAGGVQVWPLGFGGDVDLAGLNALAAGGSTRGCDGRAASKPRARVARDSGDVLRTLSEVFAASSCAGLSRSDGTVLNADSTRDLKIGIPVIATDGSITVAKGDPKVRVDFMDPKGRQVPSSGKLDDAEFQRSGENSVVEKLRVVNPMNGTWTVRLSAPAQLAKQFVSATAIWQGAVNASLIPEPPSARPGQAVTVRLSLITRRGAVTDPKALADLEFTVQATGPALSAPQSITVRDDGKAPDERAGDGGYAGTFTAPAQAGDLTFTGVVSGHGVFAQRLPVTVAVSADASVPQGRVAFASDPVVHPGTSVRGTITMDNPGAPFQGRLLLEGSDRSGATLGGGTDFTVAGGRSTRTFDLRFPKDAGKGGTSLTVRVVDAADPNKRYANGLLTVTVDDPPGWAERHRFALVGAALLALALVLLVELRRRARRRARDVRGLQASLRREGVDVCRPLRPYKNRWAAEFPFAVRDAETDTPTLGHPGTADRTFRARRGAPGEVVVTGPSGDHYRITLGGAGEPFGDAGLTLAFTDTRRARRGGGPAPRTPGSGQEASGAPAASPAERAPSAPAAYDDPWI